MQRGVVRNESGVRMESMEWKGMEDLHTARNIPFELNSIAYSPLVVIAIMPPDSAR